MLSTNFYVTQTEAGEIIRDVKSTLQISIRKLDGTEFNANPSELQFYCKYKGGYLVFETVHIKNYQRPMVAAALQWYTCYVGMPDLEISSQDPRAVYNGMPVKALANISQTVE